MKVSTYETIRVSGAFHDDNGDGTSNKIELDQLHSFWTAEFNYKRPGAIKEPIYKHLRRDDPEPQCNEVDPAIIVLYGYPENIDAILRLPSSPIQPGKSCFCYMGMQCLTSLLQVG